MSEKSFLFHVSMQNISRYSKVNHYEVCWDTMRHLKISLSDIAFIDNDYVICPVEEFELEILIWVVFVCLCRRCDSQNFLWEK